MATPTEILDLAKQRAAQLEHPLVLNTEVAKRIETVCRYLGNRACVRFILACSLAKASRPEVDIRKPYTEIFGATDSYSGRSYDEGFVTAFVFTNSLPCNPTTAFLTHAFHNRDVT